MWWLVGVVAVVVVVATYLTWVAARVDRLHHRVEAAYAALDAQLARRAAAAVVLAESDGTLGDRAGRLHRVATAALRPAADGREVAENELTRVLRDLPLPAPVPAPRAAPEGAAAEGTAGKGTAGELVPGGSQLPGAEGEALVEVVSASRRVALARQVHTDLVRETLAARRRPVVRMLGLDRRHRRPAYFDIEDPVLDG